MASINVAPFVGAIVFNQRAWRAIPERYRAQLIEVTKKGEAELERSMRGMESELMKVMGNYGLIVNRLSPEQEQMWYEEFSRAIPSLVGTLYDRDIYRRIEAMLRSRRAGRR